MVMVTIDQGGLTSIRIGEERCQPLHLIDDMSCSKPLINLLSQIQLSPGGAASGLRWPEQNGSAQAAASAIKVAIVEIQSVRQLK